MFHEKLYLMILSLPQSHMPTLMISLISLAIILIMPKIPLAKKLPAPLWAMVVATCIQSYYQFPGVATIGTAFGGSPQG